MLQGLKEFFLIPIQFFQSATKLHYAAIGVGLFVAFLYFHIFFRDASGFAEDTEKAGMKPGSVDGQWSKQKIMIWLLLSIGSGILAYYKLLDWFPY